MPKPNHQVPAAGEIGSAGRTSFKGRRSIRRPRSASASSWGKNKTQVGDVEKKVSSTVPALYDVNADIEEEYRLFLENVRVYENDDFVLEYEGVVVRYGAEAVADGGGREAPPVKEEKAMVVAICSVQSSDDSARGVPDHNQLDGSVRRQKAKMVEGQKNKDQKKRAIVL